MDYKLIEEYKKSKVKVKPQSNFLAKSFSKLLLSIIFLMLSIIAIKKNSDIKSFFNEEVFNEQISFVTFNDIYNKYFGEIIPSINQNTEAVFNESLEYEEINKVNNSYELRVSKNYMVPSISSGIIVYLGDKDELANTCIIQGVDGVDIWYSNIDISNLTLYDYVEKGSLLSLSLSDKLYLTFNKNNEYLTYEEYKS